MFHLWHVPSATLIGEFETHTDLITFIEDEGEVSYAHEWVVHNDDGLDNERSLWYNEFVKSVKCLNED